MLAVNVAPVCGCAGAVATEFFRRRQAALYTVAVAATVIATVAITVAAHEPSPDKIAREFIQPIGRNGRADALH